MAYTHFRYIAYQVPTVAEVNAAPVAPGAQAPPPVVVYGIPPGALPAGNRPPLLGNVGALGADAQVRVERLIASMTMAYLIIRANNMGDNDNTLKIFMAPEFYFRPNNATVSYTYAEYQAIKDVLRKTIDGDARFKHWLVVPGTIMWSGGQGTNNRVIPAVGAVFFNSCIYIKQGIFSATSQTNEKYEASNIDGIPSGRHGGNNPNNNANNRSTNEMWPGAMYQTEERKRKHVFKVDGIKLGLDICLEHDHTPNAPPAQDTLRIVRKTLNNWVTGVVNKRNKRIHLHLLTAGGMSIIPSAVSARTNGWIMRTDGYSAGPATNLRQVNGYFTQGNPQVASEAHVLAAVADLGLDLLPARTLNMNAPPPGPQAPAGHALYIPSPPNCNDYWATQPQAIKIYPPQQIP